MEKSKRLSPTKETLRKLFALSGNQCAYPGCSNTLFDEDDNFIAQICHIEAASEGGERFNENQNNEKRRHFDNLLILCYPHHIKTNNTQKYTVDELVKIKTDHESRFKLNNFNHTSIQIDNAYSELKKLSTKIEQTHHGVNRIDGKTDLIIDMLANAGFKPTESSSEQAKEFIEFAQSLRKESKPNTAIEYLTKILATKHNHLNDSDKSKILRILGLCHLQLGNEKLASENFLKAFEIDKSESAYNLVIAGHLMSNDYEKASILIDEALQFFPNSTGILASVVRISNFFNITLEEVLTKIPEDLQKNSEIALEIASRHHNSGHFEEAIMVSNRIGKREYRSSRLQG